MSDFKQRRRVLQLAGTGVAASIAGCADLNVGDDEESAGGAGASGELTAVIEPDMTAMEELQEDVESGEVPQEEAMQRQEELFEDAIENFESLVEGESDDDLRIEDDESDFGLYLVDGSSEVLIDALRGGDISVLGTPQLFDQIAQQQQQQQPPAEGGEEPPAEGGEEIDEEELEEIEEQMQEQMEEGGDEPEED